MTKFFINLALAVVWALVSGDVSLRTLTIGFALGFIIVAALEFAEGRLTYGRKLFQLVAFSTYFAWEIMVGALKVGSAAIFGRPAIKPRLILLPLDARTSVEITLLANAFTLTPGTVTVDVSPDRTHLILHAMFAEDEARSVSQLKDGLERRLLELMRWDS